jgi:biopolymer transport protein ExbD
MIAGSGVQMEIPGSRTTQQLKVSTITVGVTKDGKVVVAGKTLNPDQLKARLNELKKDGPVDVVLAGDKAVPLQMLLGVMDTIRGSGISSVGIAAIAEKK